MDIKNSPSGKIVKALTGYHFFVPDPLPPKFEWNDTLVNSLSKADHILGKLSYEGSKIPNPRLLIRPFITREAVLSSRIEGTQSTLEEVLEEEAGGHVNRSPDDLQEVKNYIIALDYGIQRLKDFPFSLRVIKEIHEKLMKGVRGKHATPGEFRHSQNWIGTPGCNLTNAKYIPPSKDELMDCLSAFEAFLHDRTLPPLIHIALCHYQFEAIHPFLDGNGRVGRLLISLLMLEHKMLSSPILYLSAFFEATRDEYYKHLYNISSKGTWNEWFLYFLNGVSIQSLDVLSRAERINNKIKEWQMIIGGDTSGLLERIIQHFAINPFVTVKNISHVLNVAFTTAQRAINKLETLGLVSKISDTKRGRVYCAKAILEILEEPTKINQDYNGILTS